MITVIKKAPYKAVVIVATIHFHPSLIFAGKFEPALEEPLVGLYSRVRLPANLRIGWK
jgi:hypothetical protein